MNNKAIDIAIRAELLAALPSWWDLPIVAGQQPTSQGRVDGVYFFQIGDGVRGWQTRRYVEGVVDMSLNERQWHESQYQFTAFIRDDISNMSQRTALDILRVTRLVLNGLAVRKALLAKGVGVQTASPIVTPVFVNEEGQYESVPNFSIIFTHAVDLDDNVPFVDSILDGVNRV